MAMADKQVLMRRLEKSLGDKLTARDLPAVLAVISGELGAFDVTEAKQEQRSAEYLDLLNAFLDAKEIEGCSEKTIGRYRYMLSRLLKGLAIPVREITVYHIRNNLMRMRAANLSDTTVEGARAIYSSFFRWLHGEGLIDTDPCANISAIRCGKKVRFPLSATDVERLKEACLGSREKAIVCFLLSTGCRISEVCALDRNSVDLQNMECLVHGKGNKERTVFIDTVTALLLKRYLSQRNDLNPALFVGRGGRRLTSDGIRQNLKALGKRAGVENVHPHRFRRTLATNLINRGMPLQEVAGILGHENVNTTMRYICVDGTNVKNAYRKYA